MLISLVSVVETRQGLVKKKKCIKMYNPRFPKVQRCQLESKGLLWKRGRNDTEGETG